MESKEVSGKQSISYRNYRRARDRALARLSHAYPDDYKQLLEQEKASDREQGKNWIAINGSSHLIVGVNPLARGTVSSDGTPADADKREDEGDDL